ncbi:sigma 54 modulation/S30EA-like ribosomal protein [Nocardia mexicana]|uniref:Sigma 54 modulation/S30EA-like ribosomal protein n=1 Tax=Nocardia mexicana TaxID=279262 RepID=A0A370HER8_9NOCA|nr:sigma 54 modulation/S30EA-like ribosomal protein [Nocardia mexicana]
MKEVGRCRVLTAELGSEIETAFDGPVRGAAAVARIGREVRRVLRRHDIEEKARLRVSVAPGNRKVLLVQVNTRHRGTPMRIQVSGPADFAATFAAERLDRSLGRSSGARESRVWPDPARPPLASVSERRPVVRRKECDLRACSPAEAARVMDEMDYDAHLFVDAETGEDAVVHWAGPAGVRLARQYSVRPPTAADPGSLTMHPSPALRLTDGEAANHLCRYGLPFVFFTEPRSHRGRLLLRRYDGDLALVVAARSRGLSPSER